jgi:hypothetical protein
MLSRSLCARTYLLACQHPVPDFSFAERSSFVATPSLAYNLRCCTREQVEGKVRSTLRRQRCPLHKRVSTYRFPPIDSADREHQILCFPLKSLLPYIIVHDRCARTNLCSILVYSRIVFSREPPATLRLQFRNGRGSSSPAASINRSFSRRPILPNQGTEEPNTREAIVFTKPQFSPTRYSQSSPLGCYSC